jgi:hypothetical protein
VQTATSKEQLNRSILVDDEVAFAAFSFLFHFGLRNFDVSSHRRFTDPVAMVLCGLIINAANNTLLVTWVALPALPPALFTVIFPILELALDSRHALTHGSLYHFAKPPILHSVLFHFGTTEYRAIRR